jgi:hypothetical protein
LVKKRSQTRETFPGTLDCPVSEHLRTRRIISGSLGLLEKLGSSTFLSLVWFNSR